MVRRVPGAAARRRVQAMSVIVAASCASLLMAGVGTAGATTHSSAKHKQSTNLTSVLTNLYHKAVKTGSVNWYTSYPTTFFGALATDFETTFPGVTLNGVEEKGLTSVTVVGLQEKAHKVTADVVSGATDSIELWDEGYIQKYTVPKADRLPVGSPLYTHYKGIGGATEVLTNVIAYNPKVLKADHLPVPKTWKTFAKPQWRGKFGIDPVTDDVYATIITRVGAKTDNALFTKIGNNKPIFVTSHTLAATEVESGQLPACLSVYGYYAVYLHKKDPTTFNFVNTNPQPDELSEVSVVKNAPHPNAAKLFEVWLLSPAGQRAETAASGKFSLRTNVGDAPSGWNPNKWKPEYASVTISLNKITAELNEYDKLLHYTPTST